MKLYKNSVKIGEMDDVRRALEKEMGFKKIHKSKGLDNALKHLLYSAEETGILPYRIAPEDAINIWKLVEIANEYRTKLPKKLKM